MDYPPNFDRKIKRYVMRLKQKVESHEERILILEAKLASLETTLAVPLVSADSITRTAPPVPPRPVKLKRKIGTRNSSRTAHFSDDTQSADNGTKNRRTSKRLRKRSKRCTPENSASPPKKPPRKKRRAHESDSFVAGDGQVSFESGTGSQDDDDDGDDYEAESDGSKEKNEFEDQASEEEVEEEVHDDGEKEEEESEEPKRRRSDKKEDESADESEDFDPYDDAGFISSRMLTDDNVVKPSTRCKGKSWGEVLALFVSTVRPQAFRYWYEKKILSVSKSFGNEDNRFRQIVEDQMTYNRITLLKERIRHRHETCWLCRKCRDLSYRVSINEKRVGWVGSDCAERMGIHMRTRVLERAAIVLQTEHMQKNGDEVPLDIDSIAELAHSFNELEERVFLYILSHEKKKNNTDVQ